MRQIVGEYGVPMGYHDPSPMSADAYAAMMRPRLAEASTTALVEFANGVEATRHLYEAARVELCRLLIIEALDTRFGVPRRPRTGVWP